MENNQKPKSLYDVLGETQDFFRKMKMELETGWPYITSKRNIEEREYKARKKRHRKSIWTNVRTYVGAAVIAALPAIIAVAQYCNPPKEPQLKPSANPNAMVWSYPGEYQSRNFKDIRPFGSLDEVVLRTQDGKVITLSPSDEGFEKQERAYNEKIVPYMQK